MQNVESFAPLMSAIEKGHASLEIFGEEYPEGIRVRQARFHPETGEKIGERTFAIAFLDIVESKYRGEKSLASLTAGLNALDAFVKHLPKAELVGKGVKGLKKKDIDAILADLTEKLPEMVPGLP